MDPRHLPQQEYGSARGASWKNLDSGRRGPATVLAKPPYDVCRLTADDEEFDDPRDPFYDIVGVMAGGDPDSDYLITQWPEEDKMPVRTFGSEGSLGEEYA